MSSCVTSKLSITNHLCTARKEGNKILDEEECTFSTQESSSAEWDLNQFEQLRKSNSEWIGDKQTKPKRIQDISLLRLDNSESDKRKQEEGSQEDSSNWPYESSPCAFFGKTKITSMPAKGFEGEFSHGDPEWDDRKKTRRSGGNKARQRPPKKSEETSSASESDYISDSDQSGTENDHSESEQEHSESEYTESERSQTESPHYDSEREDSGMKTPAMGRAFNRAKKPPTLKRGGHQVATPSVVKAMKGKGAFSSDDEDDGDYKLDPRAFDSDDDLTPSRTKSKGTAMDSGTYHGASRASTRAQAAKSMLSSSAHVASRREGRLQASQADAVETRKKSFSFDRAMSAADLRAARNLGAKRRQARKEELMSQSSPGSQSRKGLSPKESAKTTRHPPARAKSVGGAPAAPGSKLKSALRVFSDAAESGGAKAETKSYGSTISALRSISAATAAEGGRASDLRAAIAQQVQRSAAGLEPMEIKAKPRPKIKKTMSLSAANMVSTMTQDADSSPKEGATTRGASKLRRSKTAYEKSQSTTHLNSSAHEKLAKMRKQKMKDASDRSAMESSDANHEMESSSKRRPSNIDRRAKSFQQSRSGATLDSSSEEVTTPSRSPVRPGLQRQSSRRRNAESPKTTSPGRRLSGSPRSYDASPRKPRGRSVIALLKDNEPVTDNEMMQKGNRQMFHALMYKTKMGMDMDRLRRKVAGLDVSSSSNDEDNEDDEDASGSDSASESG